MQEGINHGFARPEVKQSRRLYLETLIDQVERKNCWQMAEVSGEEHPWGMQRLLCNARWDADIVRDDLRAYVMEHLQYPEAIGGIDETGTVWRNQRGSQTGRVGSEKMGELVPEVNEGQRSFSILIGP